MTMKCINLKQKLNKKLYCKKQNKEINFKDCNNCKFKEYEIKYKPMVHKNNKNRTIKNKTKKLAKLEKIRFSIIYPNKNKCCLCPNTTNLTWHEIYRGRNRQNSMTYGLCLRLCIYCHEKYQEDKRFNNYWHIQGQKAFMKYYNKSEDDFINVFKISYLKGDK